MKIALIGYGKMGQEIGRIAEDRGHEIALIIDMNNPNDLTKENLKDIDVAIEFTNPTSAVANYMSCFEAGVPVVSGTTGWLDQWDQVTSACTENNSAFLYASNFSLGVNLFFELNKQLAQLMKPFDQYRASMVEVHHTQKLDAPSGTAISLAEDMLDELPNIDAWVNEADGKENELPITSVREGEVPGTHIVEYDSEVDYLKITHCAKSRKGFAFGAVLAGEFAAGKKGVLSMSDLLQLKK